MSGNRIPPESRVLVKARDRDRCARCGAVGAQWHHRRTRAVRDSLTHSPCNGVWLDSACHLWVHRHPEEARDSGWIVSRWGDPRTVFIQHALYGLVLLTEDGGIRLTTA